MKAFPAKSRNQFSRYFSTPEEAKAFWLSEQRFLKRLRDGGSYDARAKLEEAPEWLSVRGIANVLACSKSTVGKLIKLGLLKSMVRRTGKQRRIRLHSDNVVEFLHFADRLNEFLYYFPAARPGGEKLLERAHKVGRGAYRSIPGVLTVKEAAIFLGCSASSVIRLIHSGQINAFRVTPCRWGLSTKALGNVLANKLFPKIV